MRALILAFGTRGDIEPYLALAHRLVSEGHQAVLCCPSAYRADAERSGVGFEPMGDGIDALMRSGLQEMDGSRFSVKLIRSMTAAMEVSLGEQWAAAERVDPTVVIAHPKALAGFHIAQARAVPFVASLPLPFLTPTAAFPAPFVTARLPGWANRATYAINRFPGLAYGGMIDRFRRETLGLDRVSRFSDSLRQPDGSDVPVLYGFSEHVVPVPTDYPPSAHVTGYWFRPAPEAWEPPAELERFLDRDEPVVYVGFGSMGFGRGADERGALVAAAIERAGVAAVVATGWGGIAVEPSDRVHVIDEVPHSWLFPRVAGVVHHGGAGTTAAGLCAGAPSLVCPFLGDQFFWGRRIHAIGAGPAPFRLRRASADELAVRLRSLVDDPGFRSGAAQVGERIRAEDGTGRAVGALELIERRAVRG